MTSKYILALGSVFMIRPHRFHTNPETAVDNAFQRSPMQRTAREVAKDAYHEVTSAAKKLEIEGGGHIFEDPWRKNTPNLVFPNNCFSTHSGGHVAVFSMFSPSRRRETL